MSSANKLAQLGALIGDSARAVMLCALMDGQSHSATDLALTAGVSPQTASWHLAKLTDGQFVSVERRGRNRWFRLASPVVAQTLEAMMALAGSRSMRSQVLSEREQALRHARTCYDHFAGKLGVALTEALTERELIVLSEDGGLVTSRGEQVFSGFGIAMDDVMHSRRRFCRSCLDWSEQRPHLAGALGAALTAKCFDLGWVRRIADTRAVSIVPAGIRGFAEQFGVRL